MRKKVRREKVIVGKWGIRLNCPVCHQWFDTYLETTDYGGIGRIYHCCLLEVVRFIPEYWFQFFICIQSPDGKRTWHSGGLYGKFNPLNPVDEKVQELNSLKGYKVT